MILGRPSNLVLGAFTALLNLAVLVAAAFGYPVTVEIVAAVNIAAAAIITLVANQQPTVNEGSKVTVVTPNGDPNRVITA